MIQQLDLRKLSPVFLCVFQSALWQSLEQYRTGVILQPEHLLVPGFEQEGAAHVDIVGRDG
jgi:hypothetical protein